MLLCLVVLYNRHWVISPHMFFRWYQWARYGVLRDWLETLSLKLFSHVSLSLPHCLNIYPSNLYLILSSFLPFLCLSPPHPPFLSLSLVPTFPALSIPPSSPVFSPTSSLPFGSSSFSLNLPVRHSEERGEECSEHVRSPKVPLGSGEQRGVVLLALCGVKSRNQRPVPVPHLPRRPGHPGLSWPGAEQSG